MENYVVAEDDNSSKVDLYLHRSNSVLSQYSKPHPSDIHNFQRVALSLITAPAIVRLHGSPMFIKADIQNFDRVALKMLFLAGIHPDYLSVKSTSKYGYFWPVPENLNKVADWRPLGTCIPIAGSTRLLC